MASRPAIARVAPGAIVEQSITRLPRRTPFAAPSGPNRTASTSGVSETQMRITSLAAATLSGVSAAVAPSLTRSTARAGVRFQTVTGRPERTRWPAIAAPIVPSPRNPIRSIGRF